jgi:SpoVK/Ycf46/Vps4 family AAA+-type ATPase
MSKGPTHSLHEDGKVSSLPSLTQSRRPRNLVIGATNRPFDVDAALLRRLTVSYQVPLPNFAQRVVILQNMLTMTTTSTNHGSSTSNRDDVDDSTLSAMQEVNFEQVAMATKGYSPSDLRHLLQTAVVTVMREAEEADRGHDHDHHHRPLTTLDIFRAMQSVPATPLSPHYRAAMAQFTSRRRSKNSNVMDNSEAEDEDDYDDDFSSEYNPFQQQRHQRNFDSSKWETKFGNFYSLGSLEVDPKTFDILTQLAREYKAESDRDPDDDENDDDDNKDDDDQEHHDSDDSINNNNNNSNTMDEWWSQERDRYKNDDAFEDLD